VKGGARPGARIGRFRLERPAGQGRRPGVWRAREITTGQPVAIELLDGWPATDPAAGASFNERLAAVARLRDSSIAAVLEHGIEDGTAYVVSVWTGSTTLASLVPRQAPRPSHLRLTLGALASALAVAHAADVPHLDLQPGNVAVDPQRRLQLTHFLPAGSPLRPEVARLIGAPAAYWSPELVGESTADASADAYGLGLLLYELACGAPVIAGDRRDRAPRRLHEDLRSLAEANPVFARTDIALCTLCDELLAHDPHVRPSLAESAERLLAPHGTPPVRSRAFAARPAEPASRQVPVEPAEPLSSPLAPGAGTVERQLPPALAAASATSATSEPSPRMPAMHDARQSTLLAALGLLGAACLLTVRRARATRRK
jgi:serine/threonine protein kinase